MTIGTAVKGSAHKVMHVERALASAGTGAAAWKSATMSASQLSTARGARASRRPAGPDAETAAGPDARTAAEPDAGTAAGPEEARVPAHSTGPIELQETGATEPRVIDTRRRKARRKASGEPFVLERYRLRRRLGSGAFGTVWSAHDERLDREVAVKILPRDRVVGGRFEREARAAARLQHPTIVTLYEAAVDDEGAYLVSELVRGGTLDQLLDDGRLSDRDILQIGISLCDALEHAHAEGVIHRDVKPGNVLVPDRPNPGHFAKLTDFGVARVIGGDSLTRTGDVIGTAAYMAPEQAEGRDAGVPADIYALALVVYEALTGVNPVRTGTAAVNARRLGAHLPPLRRQRRDLPRELGVGIDLALRPRARERGTVSELRRALDVSLDQVGEVPGIVGGGFTCGGRHGERRGGCPPEVVFSSPARDGETQNQVVVVERKDWVWRAVAAVAAGAGAAWLCSHLLERGSLPPGVAGAGTALLVLLLPRIGWMLASALLVTTAIMQARPGGALMLVLITLIPVVLLPGRGVGWPMPAGAVALGLVGLGGAWPAVAGRVGGSIWRRAALGAAGWLWLLCAAPLAGRDLYARQPRGMPGAELWTTSLQVAWHDVLTPIATSELLNPAPIWAVAAVILPWLLRSRSLAARAVLVTAWSAALLAGTEVALRSGDPGAAAPRGAVLGAIAAGIIALIPTLREVWAELIHPASPREQLP
jgi:eukaryotic-like serine/threonine-protein kinase